MNVTILLVTTAWLAGSDCGTPACAPSCDTCCEVKEKKSLFDKFKKKKKDECCDPCATCAPACPAPAPTCECEDPCKPKKEGLLSKLFKKKKKDECCDPCTTCDTCGSDHAAIPGTTIVPSAPIQVMPKAPGGENVPLPKDPPKDKPKTGAAPGISATPTSSPKPLELGSSPY